MFDIETNATKPLTFDVATAAIQGKRDYQEDTIIANFPVGQAAGFAIVADGIGGHAAGHIASALATIEVFAHLKIHEGQLLSGALNVPLALREAAEQANARLAAHVAKDAETKGMGSTLLVPVIRGDRLYWLSVGDSPLYLFRNGALRQLNKDHSMSPQIDMMVKTGAMTAEAAKDHPDRNTLTSVVSGEKIAQIDCPASPVLLAEGDILIAGSDGLQFLTNATIANTLMLAKEGRSVDLVNAFLAALDNVNNPDQDNTTFVVIKIGMDEDVDEVMDLDSMPVLAQASDAVVTSAVKAAPAAPEKDERKAYFYRGQKYYRD